MYSLPSTSKEKEPKCKINVEEVKFLEGPPKQVAITIENLGDAACAMKASISVRPSTTPQWTETSVTWVPAVLQPGETAKTAFGYEWANGTTYFSKVMTEKGSETMAYGQAP